MLAKLVRELPVGDDLLYEPKWDGFRCIVFRSGDEVELGSRNERPLTRYFPELVESLKKALPEVPLNPVLPQVISFRQPLQLLKLFQGAINVTAVRRAMLSR